MKWPPTQFAQFAASLAPTFSVAKLNRRRLIIGCAVLLAMVALTASLIAAWSTWRAAQRGFEAARALNEKLEFAPFEKSVKPRISNSAVALMQSHQLVRSIALFNDSIFAATDGGLIEMDADGNLKHSYSVLDGLPESDLTALAVFNSKLFIGTRSQGLAVLSGPNLEQPKFEIYRWTDRRAQAVTALLADRGRLLIGTFAGGLLEFDGQRFREIKTTDGAKDGAKDGSNNGQRLTGINCLLADGARLIVGTFANGIWINDAASWHHFTVADGLPSNRIVGLSIVGDHLITASDFGISSATFPQLTSAVESQRRFQTIATLPALSGLARVGNAIFLSQDDGKLFSLATDSKGVWRINSIDWARPENLSSCQLTAFSPGIQTGQTSRHAPEQALWLLGSGGLWRTSWQDERFSGRLSFKPVGKPLGKSSGDDNDQPLTSNLVSSLAFDDVGNLWVGTFRNGIDVFTQAGRKLAHLESDAVREINSLTWNPSSKRMLAATAQGLIAFDDSMQPRVLTAGDGLPANSIAHIAIIGEPHSNRLAIATSRGLALGDGKQFQTLTTVQGLPSNSVYALLNTRDALYAGTLSGLAQITSNRVTRVFKDSNSKLATNWVTALGTSGQRIFVGTYGGGLFELMPSGELASFASEIGKQTINPNAIFSDDQWLYLGTLDGAWALNLRSQKWTHLKDELPSATVMSVTGDDDEIYFATTGGIARIKKSYLRVVEE